MFNGYDKHQHQAMQAVRDAIIKWVYVSQKNIERLEASEPETLKAVGELRLEVTRLQVVAMNAGVTENAFPYMQERAAFDALLQLSEENGNRYRECWVYFNTSSDGKLNVLLGVNERVDLMTAPNIKWTTLRLPQFNVLVWIYRNSDVPANKINTTLEEIGKAGLFDIGDK